MDELLAGGPKDDEIAPACNVARQRHNAEEQGGERERQPTHDCNREFCDVGGCLRRGNIRPARHKRHSILPRDRVPSRVQLLPGGEGGHGGWPCLQDDLALPLCDQEDRQWTPSHRSNDHGDGKPCFKAAAFPCRLYDLRRSAPDPIPARHIPGNTLLDPWQYTFRSCIRGRSVRLTLYTGVYTPTSRSTISISVSY